MGFGAQRLSLRGRALQALAQREQSRVELRRKLLRHATAASRAAGTEDEEPAAAAAAVETLLDALEREGLLSSERFVESRIHAREQRFGNLRIRSELAQHRMAVDPARATGLAESELARAAAVRERRFGSDAPADTAARAAQSRFLAQRGFTAETVHRLLRALGP